MSSDVEGDWDSAAEHHAMSQRIDELESQLVEAAQAAALNVEALDAESDRAMKAEAEVERLREDRDLIESVARGVRLSMSKLERRNEELVKLLRLSKHIGTSGPTGGGNRPEWWISGPEWRKRKKAALTELESGDE